ncbi:MAG: ammonium transporter, partial [Pseudomonas sp.]|nr:ammonium transporter [Pseudomonas sp.]
MDNTALTALQYGFDTFYFLICGALVMWMAAGFAMLESGLVRAKNTTEILTKNVALYAVASVMYLVIGYHIMYSSPEGGILPSLGFLIGDENTVESVLAGGDDAPYYSARSDFFFQVVFAATCMSIVSGAVAERMKLRAFLAFAV